MNNTISGDIVNRHKPSKKTVTYSSREINISDSNYNNITNSASILSIRPSPKLTVSNFEFNKNFLENITIKNLMSFPVVLKLRSSDNKKLEVNKNSIKLSPNKSLTVELNIRIDSNLNSSTSSNLKNIQLNNQQQVKDNKIMLYVIINSEVGDIKYFVELLLKSEKSDRPERPERSERSESQNKLPINEKITEDKVSEVKESLIEKDEEDLKKLCSNSNQHNISYKTNNLSDFNLQTYQNLKNLGELNLEKDEDYLRLESAKVKINLYHETSDNLNTLESVKDKKKFDSYNHEFEQDFSNEFMSYRSSIHKDRDEKSVDKNKFTELVLSNDIASNFSHFKTCPNIIQERDNLLQENKILKIKIENLMVRFKEFENLIKNYVEIISSYESNKLFESESRNYQRKFREETALTFETKFNSTFNHLQIDYVESLRFLHENEIRQIYEKADINSNLNSRVTSDNYQVIPNLLNETPLEERLGLNYNYSNMISPKVMKKSKSIDFHSYKAKSFINYKYNEPLVTEIDYDNKINLFINANANKFLAVPIRSEKLKQLYKINYDEIENEILNSIKERFIEVEYLNYKENQIRVECMMQLIDNINNLLFNFKQFSGHSIKNEDVKINSNNVTVNSSFLSNNNYSHCNYNFYSEKNLNKLEKLINNLNKILAPILALEFSLSTIESEITKKISIVSQDPILSSEELEYLYKDIQNLVLISNELNNYKLKNKKLIFENNLLTNQVSKKDAIIEEYKINLKSLEEDIDLYKKELIQKDDNANTKEHIIDELKKENLYLKDNYIRPDNYENTIREFQERINLLLKGNYHDYEDLGMKNRLKTDDNIEEEELFKLISIKDDEIIELKSELVLKNNIIDNLKNRLDRKSSFNNR